MTQSNKHTFNCSIGIDMGAKYTGVFYSLFDPAQGPDRTHSKAMTLVLPEPGPKYSLEARTNVRHRLRAKKRFVLVRRLALLIVKSQLTKQNIKLTEESWSNSIEAISSLLKRRGYTRPNADGEDLSPLSKVRSDVFASHPALRKYFTSKGSLAEQWEIFSSDIHRVEKFLKDTDIPDGKKFVEYSITENLIDRSEKKVYLSAFSNLKANAEVLLSLRPLGHKPRTEYFKEIKNDIQKDSRLDDISRLFGSVDRFACLLGHLSNLQLRALRWYFNDSKMLTGAYWDEKRFQKTLVRALKFFHPTKDQNKKLLDLISKLEESKDIIESLCSLDANLTIPPYEDQNNRRPPLDQTLYLSPVKLQKNYGDAWKAWATCLIKKCPLLKPTDDILLRSKDRKSRILANGNQPLPDRIYALSYALQRAFDRTKLLDPFAIRSVIHGGTSQRVIEARTKLQNCIGEHNVQPFLDCAKRYFEEVANAKVGLWFDDPNGLLERSDLHPPMKSKILPILIANVLQIQENIGEKFIESIWHKTIKGRETVASRCARIETIRKNIGSNFNLQYNKSLYKKENKIKIDQQDNELLKIRALVQDTADFIAKELGLTDEQKNRISNPFSLSQLYTLIETEINGFSSTTLAAHLENAWRMTSQPVVVDDKTIHAAQCTRLPAESVRPFDGLIRRLIDRQSWEIAERVSSDISNQTLNKNTTINISLFVEENKFNFSASIAEIKNNKKSKEFITEIKKTNQQWENKYERIKQASGKYCPYDGAELNSVGEIDHILPRSLFRGSKGIIFNSEANLIYVTPSANQQKKNTIYRLSNKNQINDKYLLDIFHTTDRQAIANHIDVVVKELIAKGSLKYFDSLNKDEQNCVRNALFLDDDAPARIAVLDALNTQREARVNGTQNWMIKNLANKIRSKLDKWCQNNGYHLHFTAATTDVFSAHTLRKSLGEKYPEFNKPEIQPIASHSIDALCSLSVGSAEIYQGKGPIDFDDPKTVYGIYPQTCDIIRLTPKPQEEKINLAGISIFKDGIYAENFLPIFTLNNKIYIGYENFNKEDQSIGAIQVTGKNPEHLLTLLSPFLDKPINDLSKHTTYKINKNNAFRLFTKSSLQNITTVEQRQVKLLNSLRFNTTRKNIQSIFFSSNGKLKNQNEILNLKKFQLKISTTGEKSFNIKGLITIPLINEWLRIINSPEIAPLLGKECSDEEFMKRIAKIWKRPINRDIDHVPTHRVFSLPLLDKPSGGFRICRTSFSGTPLYQVHAINARKIKGFSSSDRKINWSNPILFPYLNTENVISCEPTENYRTTNEIPSMFQWRKILEKDNLTVYLAPGTQDRRYVRIQTSFVQVKKWFHQCFDNYNLISPLQLPGAFRIKNEEAYIEAVGKDLINEIGVPRGDICLERIMENQRVQFSYTVKSSSNSMNNRYNQPL